MPHQEAHGFSPPRNGCMDVGRIAGPACPTAQQTSLLNAEKGLEDAVTGQLVALLAVDISLAANDVNGALIKPGTLTVTGPTLCQQPIQGAICLKQVLLYFFAPLSGGDNMDFIRVERLRSADSECIEGFGDDGGRHAAGTKQDTVRSCGR